LLPLTTSAARLLSALVIIMAQAFELAFPFAARLIVFMFAKPLFVQLAFALGARARPLCWAIAALFS
jgi:hypothetical protein